MNSLDLLLEIQENQKILKEGIKVLKDDSYINVLKKLKEEFENEKVNFKKKEKELSDLNNRINELNIELTSVKEEQNKEDYKLYNNGVSNYHVLEAIQNSMEYRKSIIKDLEDQKAGLMKSQEKILKDKENSKIKLRELKNSFYSCKEDTDKKINKAKEDIKKVEINIHNLEKLIPPKLLLDFNNIKKTKGTGAAEVQNNVCSGCRMYLSSIVLDDIKQSKKIVYCDHCGRILYYNDKL
ncbi:C4-type zinc ribbon domain-containing protein [Clostridium sp. OS1-26]|uniref:zinc ribbon domain-containing protein n=1 Tax=Clostridium sp. OS1-26 TaxID=3070681 RepID=UPI0027DF0B2A|nr:C4-type zinc ribbon domain-containing protein [Clostridium sp. OS1-26]WML35600.1 C4-type zinc ribbon domain-containing protein [Clostridium sp. OS1-26]